MFELFAFLVIAAIAIAVVGAIAALIVLIACSILIDKWYDDEAKTALAALCSALIDVCDASGYPLTRAVSTLLRWLDKEGGRYDETL